MSLETMEFGTVLEADLPTSVERLRTALADQGFGILSDIDVAATLKQKLDVDRAPYRILGACNPNLAKQALEIEPQIGLLLPCNIIVYALPEGGTRISFFDPQAGMDIAENPKLEPIGREARERLQNALAAL